MKFTADAGDLARALALVKGCVPARTTLPILQHVLVEATAGRVSVLGSSIDTEARAFCAADVAVDGKAALHAEVLFGIVRRLPKAAQVTIAVDDGATAKLTSIRADYGVRILDPEVFPAMVPHEGVAFSIPAADLTVLIASTVAATVNGDSTHWYHGGVHLHANGSGKFAAVGTDDKRLALREVDLPIGAASMPPVTIAAAAARLIVELIDGAETADLIVDASRVSVRTASAQLSTRLLAGKFPDYTRVLPPANTAAATVRPGVLADAVDRAVVIFTATNEKVPAVGITPEVAGLSVRAGGRGAGDGAELVEAEIHGPADEIGVNAKFLTEMLRLWPDVPIEYQPSVSPGGPILFTSREEPAYRQIIMPMRR